MRITFHALLAVIRSPVGYDCLKAIDDLELCLRCNFSQKKKLLKKFVENVLENIRNKFFADFADAHK